MQAVIEMALHRHMMEKVVQWKWTAGTPRAPKPSGLPDRHGTGLADRIFEQSDRTTFGLDTDALLMKPLSSVLSRANKEPLVPPGTESGSECPGLFKDKAGISLPVLFTQSFR
ncbi:MAG: hypothetical protein IPJ35_05245 [Elusimicrobia bacterium]|nr:hypothetical protein [Elusimicrobiota bacterium]